MLIELSIRDLALIERAELRFGPGLNVITGETGAGKSLLVGALELLLGEAPRGGAAGWVRKGAEEARVEGRVVIAGDATLRVRDHLAVELPEIAASFERAIEDGEAELVLGRSLARDGRTRAHVDQRPVPRRALRALAPLLFEIHGQSDHQKLFEPAEQLELLDAYGGLGALRGEVATAHAVWRALRERENRLAAERSERRDRLDLLRFQRGELERAGLEVGEHGGLDGERRILRNAGELRAELDGLVAGLTDADDALLDRLRAAERTLARWEGEVGALAPAAEDLRSAAVHVEEAAAALRSFKSGVEDDPLRLEAVEERLAELERLEHKHDLDEAGLIARRDGLAGEIRALEEEEQGLETLGAETTRAEETLVGEAARLSRRRRTLAPRLARAVVETLGALGLGKARFEAVLRARGGPDAGPQERHGATGADAIEFLLSANPGEELRPLRHVASGGEAARIMLALRTVLRGSGLGRTLVFDEIDAGVGGRLGPEVGRHLRALAEGAQVLCVTHLPAIAAQAHVHLRAAKEVRENRTRTTVAELAGDERVREVAAMIAGGADEATARAEATRLLAQVR